MADTILVKCRWRKMYLQDFLVLFLLFSYIFFFFETQN